MNTNHLLKPVGRLIFASLLVSMLALAGGARASEKTLDLPEYQLFVSTVFNQSAGVQLRSIAPTYSVTYRELAVGAPLHGTNGINFGPDGNLYIASFIGGDIIVMDPNSGRIIRHIPLTPDLQGPDDLTFAPDGSLYWTSIATGNVGKLAPDGTQSIVSFVSLGVNPITFSDDGRLFVALDFLGEGLYEIDPQGVEAPRLIIQNLGWLNGFDFGPDGLLYGPIYNQGKVVKINVDSAEMETVATGFAIPVAAKFGPDGQLYLNDQGTGEVFRLDPETGERQVVARLTPGLDNLAFDREGRLFVSQAEEGTVYKLLPNAKGLPISPGGMVAPGGVAVLPPIKNHERVFVTDFWTLREFNGQTGQTLSVDRHVLGSPQNVASDGDNLLVASWFDNLVYTYDPLAMTILDARPDFTGPVSAIRFQDDLVVSELYTGMVVRSSGPGDRQVLAQLYLPTGLAANGDDLWVADWVIGSVFQLVKDGEPVFIPVAQGLAFPEGLAVGPDGNLLVVESGKGQVSRIDLISGEVTPFVEGLEIGLPPQAGVPPFWVFNGIATGPSGAIYVSGDKANVVYRLDVLP